MNIASAVTIVVVGAAIGFFLVAGVLMVTL
jgi:hypothetical protein